MAYFRSATAARGRGGVPAGWAGQELMAASAGPRLRRRRYPSHRHGHEFSRRAANDGGNRADLWASAAKRRGCGQGGAERRAAGRADDRKGRHRGSPLGVGGAWRSAAAGVRRVATRHRRGGWIAPTERPSAVSCGDGGTCGNVSDRGNDAASSCLLLRPARLVLFCLAAVFEFSRTNLFPSSSMRISRYRVPSPRVSPLFSYRFLLSHGDPPPRSLLLAFSLPYRPLDACLSCLTPLTCRDSWLLISLSL